MKKKNLNKEFTFDKLVFKKEKISAITPGSKSNVKGGNMCNDTGCTMDPCPPFLTTRVYSGGSMPA
ncbi:hypothetical protein [Kordia jejudonensis]|uniref:hypothetical protein n=1 Tax=Kordia jejudonensis TaxID=1348245 RepID=UPI00062913E6|nr:hypothetical protein [Kordia jejudonensis]